jgi:N-terminal domain of toast_rack, DUF2154
VDQFRDLETLLAYILTEMNNFRRNAMKHISIYLIVATIALTTLACGISINLPVTNLKTGPTVTDDIFVPFTPSSIPVDLTLGFGAGELKVAPGAQDALVQGTATYNLTNLKPEVSVDGNQVNIQTGELEIGGIPSLRGNLKNEWDLKLSEVPTNLTINAGAYKSNIELGGLAILSLTVSDGAAEVDVNFSEPNKAEMSTLRYDSGASSVTLGGLANSNAQSVIFKGGAGEYTLDFSGNLQKDMDVRVDTGMSSIIIIVPKGTSARVLYDGGLSNVDVSGEWEKVGNDYYLNGDGPRITINVNLGAGNLQLRNR